MMRWSVPISTRRNRRSQGDGAIERDPGPTVPAPPRYRPPQLSSLERGGKLSCPQSLENTQNRKIHETAPGAVDDALERADLNSADRPLEGVGAIERHHGTKRCGAVAISTITIVAAVRARRKFSWPQSLQNTQNRERISICLNPLPPSISITQWAVVQNEVLYTVIPAKAGIQGRSMCGQVWMPAFAGMTLVSPRRTAPHFDRLRPLVHAVAVGGSARSSDIRTNGAATPRYRLSQLSSLERVLRRRPRGDRERSVAGIAARLTAESPGNGAATP